MGRRHEDILTALLFSFVLILLSASHTLASRDPFIGVWVFPQDDSNVDWTSRALILDKVNFGMVDDWEDTINQAPISGVWESTNGELVLKVKHSEIGEIQENFEIRWKVDASGDYMKLIPDDGSGFVVLKRLPENFDRAVILSDANIYKVISEFKYEPRDELELLSDGLHKKIIEGGYLGWTVIGDTKYYKYQFSNILKGDNRDVELYLEVPASNADKPQYLKGFLKEKAQISGTTSKPAYLFYHYHPSYDKDSVLSYMAYKGLRQDGMSSHPNYVSCWVWPYKQTFICYPPFEWTHVDSWNCKIDILRTQ